MLRKVLIANRGEIARRIQKTCRRLGVATVAVYSDADAGAGFVLGADEAVSLGGTTPAESYLDQQKVLDAALATGADAIHPGYGFLSENATFARAVEAAGLVFVGPHADTIALMGSKIASKRAMEAAGVRCIPGYHGDDQDDATLAAQARRIGFPVLVKASAGGGGKGMRVVHRDADFIEACAAARREAQAAFGDDALLLEKFVERPRHIEVQVFGDEHGNTVHLYERECSLQRRYQKIIEEAPSAFVDATLRDALTGTAVRAAEAVNYRGAGTIEFIVSQEREFFFMEMNTRLQVEHPVTELITGLDLVEWQLRVASGEPLPARQLDIHMHGHAIEARIYAEDPFRDFMPSAGTVTAFDVPQGDHVRLDADLRAGQVISPFYDPMIAKLCVHREDRPAAIVAAARALEDTVVLGPATNLPLLRLLIRHADFIAAEMDTGYVDRELEALLDSAPPTPDAALIGAALSLMAPWSADTPWARDGWQGAGLSRRGFALIQRNGRRHDIALCSDQSGLRAELNGRRVVINPVTSVKGRLRFAADGDMCVVDVDHYGDWLRVTLARRVYELRSAPLYAVMLDGAAGADHPGAPLPGRIVKLFVAAGDSVEAGQPLVVLEGMKMEFTVTAAVTGTVETVRYAVGDQVDAEVPLVDLKPAS